MGRLKAGCCFVPTTKSFCDSGGSSGGAPAAAPAPLVCVEEGTDVNVLNLLPGGEASAIEQSSLTKGLAAGQALHGSASKVSRVCAQ